MAGVAALLAGSRPERRGDMVDVALHDVEEAAAAGDAEVGDRAFEQMAGVVELVIVAQVGPALVRLAAVVPAIEIAVGRLRLGEVVDDRVDLGLDVGIAPVRKRVAAASIHLPTSESQNTCTVKPWLLRGILSGGTGFGSFSEFEDADFRELGVLARDGALEHNLEPLAPERAGEPYLSERDRGIAASSHVYASACRPLRAQDP